MRISLLIFSFLITIVTPAQDLAFGRKMLDTLTSEIFWGRGYTKDGMEKAAVFLAAEFKNYGVLPMDGESYFQYYTHSVNTFPKKMKVNINGKELQPGVDFIVSPESVGLKAKGRLLPIDTAQFLDKKERLFVEWQEKLTWSASREVADYTAIQLRRGAIPDFPFDYEVEIDNKWINTFKAANVCGVVKGTKQPDSLIIITAHYDHLGGMGSDTYFPGANDNASGVSLLMNLARYYAAHPPEYSIGFLLFGSEEIGILGSKYFTENPLVSLPNIRFLINTDLAGTGDEGITVVNATEFPKEFAMMNQVNEEPQLLAAIHSRGKAANSDHYFFTEKGVPSFFFYTLGGITAYHDIYDRSSTLPLNKHEDLFKLVVGFVDKLIKGK